MSWFKKVLLAIGREPVKIAGLVAAGLNLASLLFLHLSVVQQGAVNAAVVVVLGFLAALGVSTEKALPMLTGVTQAILACVLAFGVSLPGPTQASIMAFVSAATAFYLRTQVEAKIGPAADGRHEASPAHPAFRSKAARL